MKTTYKIPSVALDRAALEIVGDKYRIIFLENNSKADKCYWKNGEYIIKDIKSAEWLGINELYKRNRPLLSVGQVKRRFDIYGGTYEKRIRNCAMRSCLLPVF